VPDVRSPRGEFEPLLDIPNFNVPAVIVVVPVYVFNAERVRTPAPVLEILLDPLITPETVKFDAAFPKLKVVVVDERIKGHDMDTVEVALVVIVAPFIVRVPLPVKVIGDEPVKVIVPQDPADDRFGLFVVLGIVTLVLPVGIPPLLQFEELDHSVETLPFHVLVCPITKLIDTVQNSTISAIGNFNLCSIVFIKLI